MIERLAHDLQTAFPEMKGFSPRNLKYMRAFAEAWPEAAFVLLESLPAELQTSLPGIEQIERELGDLAD